MNPTQHIKLSHALIPALLLALLVSSSAMADVLDNWTKRNSGVNASLTDVGYGNGTYVVVGNAGTILTSPDAITWTSRNSGTTANLQGVAYGNNTFVTVGVGGTILTSSNAISWTARTSGTSANFNGVPFLNGQFVAVGDKATIATSPDGINWTFRNSGIVNTNSSQGVLYEVAYGNGVYVIGGQSSTILNSSNLVNWTQQTLGSTYLWTTFGKGIFVANGFLTDITSSLLTSPDGNTWTTQTPMSTSDLELTFGGGSFVGVGDYGHIFTSTDGTNWIQRTSPVSGTLWNVKYVNYTFMAVGANGTIIQTGIILASPEIWQQPANQTTVPGSNVTFSVFADGLPPLFYQWFFNNTPIPGATNQILSLSNLDFTNQGNYCVTISNSVMTILSSNAFLNVVVGPDSDGDGIPNYWEIRYGLNPNDPTDATNYPPGDKLTYLEKYLYGLNPLTNDTDGDGLTDYDEIFVYHTNPLSPYTAGDGISDGWKVQYGINPLIAIANNEAGFNGTTYLQVYQYDITHTNQLDPNKPFALGSGSSNYEIISNGQHTNKFYYDHEDRLIGMESSRGISIAYQYDGNGNLTRQTVLSRASETNGLPVLWQFLNGLTNGTAASGPNGDPDGDGWSNYQEWLAGTDPRNAQSAPTNSVAIETAPAAVVLPSNNPLGSTAIVTVRLWDNAGNPSTPFVQYQISGATNWQDATLFALDGMAYNVTNRVAALPGGVNHTLAWNAMADLGPAIITNVLLRARAQDFMLLGDWSLPTPFQLNTTLVTNLPVNFTGVAHVQGGIQFNWQGSTNAWLYLQRSPALAGTNAVWVNIWTGAPPTLNSGSYTDFFGTNPMGFYRLKVVNP